MKKRSELPQINEAGDGRAPLDGDRQFVAALWRGMEVLRVFAPRDDGLSNQEIAARTGFSPSTVSRLTYTLSVMGHLRYVARDGRYRLGMPVLGLGLACLAGLAIRHVAHPMMQELADFAGAGTLVSLSMREGLAMTYIHSVRSDTQMSLSLDLGTRINLARSSAGRVWLAASPAEEREAVLTRIAAEEAGGAALVGPIRESLAGIRERGYALNIGGWRPGVNVVAVPIAPQGADQTVYALGCGGPSFRLTPEYLEGEIAPRLLDIARRIAASRPG